MNKGTLTLRQEAGKYSEIQNCTVLHPRRPIPHTYYYIHLRRLQTNLNLWEVISQENSYIIVTSMISRKREMWYPSSDHVSLK